MPIGPGQTLAHYRLIEKIGAGGMGEVWKARDTTLDRDVAIKMLPADVARDTRRLARFEREAKLLATLNHPQIAGIYGLHRQDEVVYIAMELVPGEDLARRLARGPLPLAEAVRIAVQIAAALGAAHERGVVHRDLKPANILITPAGEVKVLDFGLAKRLETHDRGRSGTTPDSATATMERDLTQEGTTLGTLAYMAPEQLRAGNADARADIFSFGVVLYEMIAGANPFRRAHTYDTISGILRDDPPPLTRSSVAVPRRLDRIVNKAMAKDVDRRYQQIRQVGTRLEALHRELVASDQPGVTARGLLRALRRPRVVIPVLVVTVAATLAAIRWSEARAERRWALETGLPELERLVNASWRDFGDAYADALQLERVIPGHPRLEQLLSKCSMQLAVRTRPAGARVSVKNYGSPDAEWQELGITPIEAVRLPTGVLRWKLEKPGFETVHAVESTWAIRPELDALLVPNDFQRTLDEAGSMPAGMVRVPGAAIGGALLPDFYIDRYEVTNREFRKFVEAGGYANPEYWEHPFVEGGETLDRERAMARFVDRTGRPGPATWSGGLFPEGEGDHPVSGVSWYEAAAYAAFAGKSLPTAGHWGLARGEATMVILFPQLGGYATFAPFSNFDGKGPVAVGSLPGMTAYGAYDMAGNVREWCFNESQNGRVIRGGSWTDTNYMFKQQSQLPPMDRSPQNGFRCAAYPQPEEIPPQAFASTRLSEWRDVRQARPVDDAVFDVMRRQFDYDPTPLKARVESRREDPGGWTHERITYNAAYGGETIIAHLFLPTHVRPPYQTVIYLPGSGSLMQDSSEHIETYFEFPVFLSFLVSNGRAVLYPVYKGTFERQDPALIAIHGGDSSRRYTEFLVQLVKDLRRSIDYLETREDVDPERIAYYGMSWGAILGGVVPAVEDRLAASVLVSGGAAVNFAGDAVAAFSPEADPVNYYPRVKVPTLMINGRYDTLLPLDKSIRPMFDLLGTPAADKQLLLFETDHIPPRDELIKATLDWLDRYLGPVR